MREPNILDYLPEVISSNREMKEWAETDNIELALLWKRIEDALNDQFIYLMTENGIKRWEKILSIVPRGTDTLEDRRFRIISMLQNALPYTYRRLEQYLNTMLGEKMYEMEYQSDIWTLFLKVALSRKSQYEEIIRYVREFIPANILLNHTLKFNLHRDLRPYTHAQLHAHRHIDLREDESLKGGN